MKKFLFLSLAVATLAVTSCKKESGLSAPDATDSFGAVGTKAADYVQGSKPRVILQGNLTATRTLHPDTVYVLKGIVAMARNRTFKILPGTYITGELDANGKPGTLVIPRDAKIEAKGTLNNPIVFTSSKLLDNNSFTHPAPGDFGGIILLGRAPANVTGKSIEGTDVIQPFDNIYGGTNPADNSGIMQYVRIEYAGYILSAGNEINGLTCGGVGSGTTLDHIEVAYGADDAFEFFGGTVNASYLTAIGCDDDSFDFDNGYRGTIQYGIAVGDLFATHSANAAGTSADSNGIESDNNADAEDATYQLTPKTHPILKNFTIVAAQANNTWSTGGNGGYIYGVRVRRGSEIELTKSIIIGYPRAFTFDSQVSIDAYTAGTSKVENNIITGLSISVAKNGAADATFNSAFVSAGNKVSVNATNSNHLALLGQPYLNNGSAQLSVRASSASPAYWAPGQIDPTNGIGALDKLNYQQFDRWAKWYY